MMFTSSGAHRLTPLLTMANPPISEYQSNVMLQFSFLPNIQFRFSPDSTTLPLSTNCSVKCVLAVFQQHGIHLMLAALLGPWGQCTGYRRGAWCQFALFTNHSPFHTRPSPTQRHRTWQLFSNIHLREGFN